MRSPSRSWSRTTSRGCRAGQRSGRTGSSALATASSRCWRCRWWCRCSWRWSERSARTCTRCRCSRTDSRSWTRWCRCCSCSRSRCMSCTAPKGRFWCRSCCTRSQRRAGSTTSHRCCQDTCRRRLRGGRAGVESVTRGGNVGHKKPARVRALPQARSAEADSSKCQAGAACCSPVSVHPLAQFCQQTPATPV